MTTEKRYSPQGFTVNLAAGLDERQQVAHLLMVENSCGWLPPWSCRVALVYISLLSSQLQWITHFSVCNPPGRLIVIYLQNNTMTSSKTRHEEETWGCNGGREEQRVLFCPSASPDMSASQWHHGSDRSAGVWSAGDGRMWDRDKTALT